MVYAFERDTGLLHKIDPSGNYLGTIGGYLAGTPDRKLAVIGSTQGGVNQATGAHGVHADSDGYIWVADRDLHTVKRLSPDGNIVLTLGEEGVFGKTRDLFNGPSQIFETKDGNILIADGYWNSRMVWFDKSGKYLREFGDYGRDPGQFGTIHYVVEDSRGRLIVSDLCDGMFVPEKLAPGQLDPQRKTPGTGCEGNRLQIVDGKDGKYLDTWRDTPTGSLAILGERLYISAGQRILVLDAATGKEVESIPVSGGGHGIAVDSRGDVYVARFGESDHLSRYTKAAR